MRNIIYILFIPLFFIACSSDDDKDPTLQFEDFTLPTGCYWMGAKPTEGVEGEITIEKKIAHQINNETEFLEYIELGKDEEIPDVDFSKNTLIVLTSDTSHKIEDITREFKMINNKYYLSVKANLDGSTQLKDQFVIAMLVDKLPVNSQVNADIKTYLLHRK